MSAFKLGSILSEQSLSQAKDSHKVVYLKLENIFPNPANEEIYATEGIEMLSYSIEDKGLLQPLVVRTLNKQSDNSRTTYELISGHRRRLAILKIMERNSPKASEFNYVPCIVRSATSVSVDSNANVSVNNEELIDGNLFNRNKSDAEKAKELARKKEILLERKKNGDKFAGRILDLIAKDMGISTHQAKKYNSINQNAAEDVKEAFDSGKISTETAYELSKADELTQQEILKHSEEQNEPLTAKKIKETVKKKNEQDAAYTTQNKDEEMKNPLPQGKANAEENETSIQSIDSESFERSSDTSVAVDMSSSSKIAEDDSHDILDEVSALRKRFNPSCESVEFCKDEICTISNLLDRIYSLLRNQNYLL